MQEEKNMDEKNNWENKIQEYFQVKRISDDGALVIHTPVKVGDDSLDLYLFKSGGKYLLTDFGYFLRVYLSDGQTEEKSRESAQKAGFDLVDREIVKYIDDSEDIIESIIEVLNWCLSEKTRILEEYIRIARSEDEKNTGAHVEITGMFGGIICSLFAVGLLTIFLTLLKVIGHLF